MPRTRRIGARKILARGRKCNPATIAHQSVARSERPSRFASTETTTSANTSTTTTPQNARIIGRRSAATVGNSFRSCRPLRITKIEQPTRNSSVHPNTGPVSPLKTPAAPSPQPSQPAPNIAITSAPRPAPTSASASRAFSSIESRTSRKVSVKAGLTMQILAVNQERRRTPGAPEPAYAILQPFQEADLVAATEAEGREAWGAR